MDITETFRNRSKQQPKRTMVCFQINFGFESFALEAHNGCGAITKRRWGDNIVLHKDRTVGRLRWRAASCSGTTQPGLEYNTIIPQGLPTSRMRKSLRHTSPVHVYCDRLVGLVVKSSASRAEDPGFESRLRQDFFGVESYQ